LDRELSPVPACCVWLTGLSASGKSTIARALHEELRRSSVVSYVLDGDKIREGLCRDLSFTLADRSENIRRIGEVAALMVDAGVTTIVAFISPIRLDRDRVRALFGDGKFVEVFVDTPMAVCQQRDPKGLYAKALRGEIPDFTGIGSVYEPPLNPEVRMLNDGRSVSDCAGEIIAYLTAKGLLAPGR